MKRNKSKKEIESELAELESVFASLGNRDNSCIKKAYRTLGDKIKKNDLGVEHSRMQMVVCDYLIDKGCGTVEVEYKLEDTKPPYLVLDVYGKALLETVGVEIETRVVKNLGRHIAARTLAKITGYSPNTDKFYLAGPRESRFIVPEFILNGMRPEKELRFGKKLTDRYYKRPKFELEDFLRANLDGFLVIDRDGIYPIGVQDRSIYKSCQIINSRGHSYILNQ